MIFVILLGIVSLFADMTYEGARSITGQYLAILGASGVVVGTVSGFAEMVGYTFRLLSGYLSDKTRQYWLITFIGYFLNLLAVPLLALAGNWQLAASLIVLERFGKALRSPAKDAMLSFATKEMGRGWGFGLHEAMDQTGAVLGPLLISLMLYFKGSYQMSFALLLIPAICALSMLTLAKVMFPHPEKLEVSNPDLHAKSFPKKYWIYIAAVSCVAAGYIDFPLIAFHFEKMGVIPNVWVPIFFAIAMGVGGVSSLVFGHLYDKLGIGVLAFVTAISALFVPFVFIDGFYASLAGMILWGLGIGSQESVMRAVVADLVSSDRRGTAYGVLNVGFGIAWFLGSSLIGYLYDLSIIAVIIVSMSLQLIAIPIFLAKR